MPYSECCRPIKVRGDEPKECSAVGRIAKIDSIKTVQARTRVFSSMGQRHNECHLLAVLSSQGIDGQRTGTARLFRCGAFERPALAARRSNYSGVVLPPGPE
jgi:hypothetical protein